MILQSVSTRAGGLGGGERTDGRGTGARGGAGAGPGRGRGGGCCCGCGIAMLVHKDREGVRAGVTGGTHVVW